MNHHPKIPAAWNKRQPSSLRDAMEMCKDFAREVHNMSIERIADRMGVMDKWSLYKWFQNGRMPVSLIQPFEFACGINYVTRWLASSDNKLLVDVPKGKLHGKDDMVQLNTSFAAALDLLNTFYEGGGTADPQATLAALKNHLTQASYHHANVQACIQPELEF